MFHPFPTKKLRPSLKFFVSLEGDIVDSLGSPPSHMSKSINLSVPSALSTAGTNNNNAKSPRRSPRPPVATVVTGATSQGATGMEKGKWQVFADAVVATQFKAVPTVDTVIPRSSVDAVVNALMQPKWWESDEKFGSTRVSLVQKERFGRVLYLRSVKTRVGPANVRLRLWTTQWAEQLAEGKSVVNMHCFDDLEKCHLVSRFVVSPQQGGAVKVVYEEVASSQKMALKLAQNKIRKAHQYVLSLVAAQVAKNAGAVAVGPSTSPRRQSSESGDAHNPRSDTPPNDGGGTGDTSQRSNTDAIPEATTSREDLTEDEEADLFGDESDVVGMELLSWEELPLEAVREQIRKPYPEGVLVSNRDWRLRTYKNVFVGNEAVDWIVEHYAVSRDGAVLLMREIQRQGWLQHVKNEHQFKDDHLFFVWKDPGKNSNNNNNNSIPDDGSELVPAKSSSAPSMAFRAGAGAAVGGTTVRAAAASPATTTAATSTTITTPAPTPAVPALPRPAPGALDEWKTWAGEASFEAKLLAVALFGLFISHISGATNMFFLMVALAAVAASRYGRSNLDDELRAVRRKLVDVERRLAEGIAAGTKVSPTATTAAAIEPDRDIAKLLVHHKAEIEQIRAELGDEIDPTLHDDIFLLRFVLSMKTVAASVDGVRKCLAWRKENASLLAMVDRNEHVPCHAIIKRYAVSDHHSTPLKDGSPLLVTRAGLCDLSSLLAHVTQAELVDWLMWLNEHAFRECDQITRKTGRLTKLVRVNDMMGASLMQDRGFFSAVGKSSKTAAFVWPQLVEKNIILNPPSLMSVLLKVAATFLSANTMAKVAMCKGNTIKGDMDDCPFASKRFNRADLPTFMGGLCTHEGLGCIGNVPNDCVDLSWQQHLPKQ